MTSSHFLSFILFSFCVFDFDYYVITFTIFNWCEIKLTYDYSSKSMNYFDYYAIREHDCSRMSCFL